MVYVFEEMDIFLILKVWSQIYSCLCALSHFIIIICDIKICLVINFVRILIKFSFGIKKYTYFMYATLAQF